MPKSGDQLKHRLRIGAKRGLRLDPGFGVRQRLEDSTTVTNRPINDTLIGEEEENSGSPDERHFRPVRRGCEVIFQMEADVTRCFFNDGDHVLVVLMLPVEGQLSVPGASQIADE
jgi:hypothetical protein